MPNSRKCTFLVRGRQCTRVGEGNPPLCEEHEAEVYGDEEDEVSEGAEIVDEFLDDVFDNPRVQGALGRVVGFVDGFAHLVDRVSTPKAPGERREAVKEAWDRTRAAAEKANAARKGVPPKRPQVPPGPPPPRRVPVEDPMVVLGFEPATKLTVELVKARYKQLAQIYHSDKGGSTESMKRLNAARDVLLARCKPKA